MASKKNKAAAGEQKKPECPVTREEFRQHAQDLLVQVGDHKIVAATKEFSTGSFGWYSGDKAVVTVNGKPVRVQVGINLTVIGSKASEPAPAAA